MNPQEHETVSALQWAANQGGAFVTLFAIILAGWFWWKYWLPRQDKIRKQDRDEKRAELEAVTNGFQQNTTPIVEAIQGMRKDWVEREGREVAERKRSEDRLFKAVDAMSKTIGAAVSRIDNHEARLGAHENRIGDLEREVKERKP